MTLKAQVANSAKLLKQEETFLWTKMTLVTMTTSASQVQPWPPCQGWDKHLLWLGGHRDLILDLVTLIVSSCHSVWQFQWHKVDFAQISLWSITPLTFYVCGAFGLSILQKGREGNEVNLVLDFNHWKSLVLAIANASVMVSQTQEISGDTRAWEAKNQQQREALTVNHMG